MNFKKKRILVTGGAGFIGSHLVNELLNHGAFVKVVDNLSTGKMENLKTFQNNKRFTFSKTSILSRNKIFRLFKKIDFVFHLAAIPLRNCEENPKKCVEVNIEGTEIVCAAAKANKVKKIIAASSSSVYGETGAKKVSEDSPHNPKTYYGCSKLCMEDVIRFYGTRYSLHYIILRYLNVFGPNTSPRNSYANVLKIFTENILAKTPATIAGDGSSTLDLIHVHDVVRANLLATKPSINNEIFNIGTGKETSLNELYALASKIIGLNIKPQYSGVMQNWDIKKRRVSIIKAKRIMNFQTKISLQKGLKDYINWYRAINKY